MHDGVITRLSQLMAMVACSLLTTIGLVTGVFAGCNGNYGYTDINGCSPLHQPFQESCCRNTAPGVYRCFTCWRDYYWCDGSLVEGSAYNCSGAGAVCS